MTCANTAHIPADLWTAARAWLADVAAEFGGATAIVTHLARRTRAALKRQLAALDALVLKLLLVEASRLAIQFRARASGPHARRCAPTHALAPSNDRVCTQGAPSQPETWRVHFPLRIPAGHVLHAQRASRGPRVRDLGRPVLMTDVWRDNARRALAARLGHMRNPLVAWRNAPAKARRLARRFEALRRVLADPRPHALRLARKLAAFGAAALGAARAIAMARAPRIAARIATQVNAVFDACRASTRYSADSS